MRPPYRPCKELLIRSSGVAPLKLLERRGEDLPNGIDRDISLHGAPSKELLKEGGLRRFQKVLVVILFYLSNIKLQTARISTILELQGRDPDRKLRINLPYTTIGGLGGVKK